MYIPERCRISSYKKFKRKKERKKITVYQTEGKGQTDGQKEVYWLRLLTVWPSLWYNVPITHVVSSNHRCACAGILFHNDLNTWGNCSQWQRFNHIITCSVFVLCGCSSHIVARVLNAMCWILSKISLTPKVQSLKTDVRIIKMVKFYRTKKTFLSGVGVWGGGSGILLYI